MALPPSHREGEAPAEPQRSNTIRIRVTAFKDAPEQLPASSKHAGALPTHKNIGQHPRVLTGEEHAGSAAGVANTRQRQDRSPNRLLYNHAAPPQSSASRMYLRSGRHAASDISGAVLQVHGPLPALAGPSGRCRNLIVLHVPFAVHDNA